MYKLLYALRANPMMLFVYSIFAKFGIIVTIGSVIVLYWVVDGLNKSGVISKSYIVLQNGINSSKAIAQNCVPRITNINDFWNCLNNTPTYNSDIAPGEKELYDIGTKLQNLINDNSQGKPLKPDNPYLK